MKYLKTPNKDFQPMGANMGILPSLKDEIKDKKERYAGYASRALKDLESFIEEYKV